ncbi:MAG TPA: radical SAM protein [Streptosporangiaceae bacterium]|nr:radical SAM protein [Streptosporangiaceae bacterium]
MPDPVRIWYVSAQRLCNFRCKYCVSVSDYAKSNTEDWFEPDDLARFEKIVRWIADRPFRVSVRLATLGEPFASRPFLAQAAWLSTRPNVDFVELLTNGSLLKRRLDQLDREGDISKVSLWVTHHHTEISVPRFIENARFAEEKYGCFVVVNGLLFPDSEASVLELKQAAEEAGLRFNLDLGYDPLTPHGVHTTLETMVPVLREEDGIGRAIRLGANPKLLRLNLLAMRDLRHQLCSAGHNYLYIGIRGDVYRCSRYQALDKDRLGNVLDEDFELRLNKARWVPCEAGFGCGNKEDFLNLRRPDREDEPPARSLGWIGADTDHQDRRP